MKNALSNALLCGVLASTFILVNCQKPPDRGVRANISPNARASAQPKLATCNDAALAAINVRKPLVEQAWQRIRASTPPLDDASKQELQNIATQLNEATTAAVAAIQALQADGGAQAEGCKEIDAANNNREVAQYTIADMQTENRRIGSSIEQLTQTTNPLVQAPSDDATQAETPVETASDDITIAANSEMLIAKQELATILKDARSKDGESFIVSANLHSGRANYAVALQNSNVTSCIVKVAVQEAAIDSEIKILNIEEKTENNRKVLELSLQVGTEASSLSCAIAGSASAAAPAAVRAALGDLVKKKEPAPAEEESSADDTTATSPSDDDSTAAPPSGDSSQADEAARSAVSGDDSSAASGDSSSASGDSTSASGDASSASGDAT